MASNANTQLAVAPSQTLTSGNEALDDLLAFYRFRLDDFDRERSLHLSRLTLLEPSRAELHRLRWEAKERDVELLTLRKAVSDAQVSVHREREIANDQGGLIVRLKAQQVEDRKSIQRLLALTQPVTGDITFIAEGSHDAGDGLAAQYQAAVTSAEESILAVRGGNSTLSAQAVAARLQSRNESLQLTIDSLTDQLTRYKTIARDKISTLYEDRNVRESQATAATTRLLSQVELLTAKLNASEEHLAAVTADYLVLRHNAQVAQRVMVEERQLLRAERAALEVDRADAARQMSREVAAAREAADGEIKLATEDFRGQVRARERDVAVLREQYEMVQAAYEARVRDLTQQVEHYKSKYAGLNRRRRLEIQGAQASATEHKREVDTLRSRLKDRSSRDDDSVGSSQRSSLQSEESIKFLKERVTSMEKQIRSLLGTGMNKEN